MHHNRRRKKQRANYGKRLVDVCRSVNGFGFTISGQQPCILSCIVPNSPADTAGLRAGDFLISVNDSNVSKLPHEVVVQLINHSEGTIRLAIAENYFSDSSDEESNVAWQNGGPHDVHVRTRRPKYPHHKLKLNRVQQQNRKKSELDVIGGCIEEPNCNGLSSNYPNTVKRSDNGSSELNQNQQFLQAESTSAHNIIHSAHASNERDITNVSAMVSSIKGDKSSTDSNLFQLEYRTVVGYLGTIEMPKQIVTSSKLQTVRSCIRKMRQEKRQPTVVLMQILPNCLKLYNSDNVLLAKYPSGRLSYVSSNNNSHAASGSGANGEVDMRFFGLITSTTYTDGQICDWDPAVAATTANNVIVSNSCHVFVIDLKLISHLAHFERAEQFSIVCTKDPVTDCCLEFPSTSDYVVNLIRSMYGLNSSLGQSRQRLIDAGKDQQHGMGEVRQFQCHQLPMYNNNGSRNGGVNSPQPSNHSEVTTASSNSDSGIGFHNDFTNVSDRIVVVDFPGSNNHNQPRVMPNLPSNFSKSLHQIGRPMPFGVDSIRNIRSTVGHQPTNNNVQMPQILHSKSRSLDYTLSGENRNAHLTEKLTTPAPDLRLIRAMPDHIPNKPNGKENSASVPTSPAKYETIYDSEKSPIQNQELNDLQPMHGSQQEDELNREPLYPITNSAILTARSCDDIMISVQESKSSKLYQRQHPTSFDDVSLLGDAPPPPPPPPMVRTKINNKANETDDYVFLAPEVPAVSRKYPNKQKKLSQPAKPIQLDFQSSDELLSYKLSPKVFGVAKPHNKGIESMSQVKRRLSTGNKPMANCDRNVCSIKKRNFNVWGSLQDLEMLNKLDDSQSTKLRAQKRDFLEAAYSEPDLTTRTLPNSSSPFRRWGQSSFRSRSNENQQQNNLIQRRTSSLAASESDVYSKSVDNEDDANSLRSRKSDVIRSANIESSHGSNASTGLSSGNSSSGGVQAWGSSFEKLLEDAAGLHTFAIFLQKEFSAENIYFWTACERYRQIEDHALRNKEANAIFSRHLAVGASEPVNVDSQARTIAQDNLNYSDRDLFLQAQKQIFNLMKFDSYQRFIRSDLYKSCLTAEAKKQQLPYSGSQLDPNLRIDLANEKSSTTSVSSKLKKSLSNAEDRRRKSLLPWHRKTRCKSKDRDEDYVNGNGSLKKCSGAVGTHTNQSQSDIHSSRSSLSSFDAVISSRSNGGISPVGMADDSPPRSLLCRVILTDGATTIVQTRHHESIRDLVDRLLEKRGICYQAYEGFVAGTNKPIDLMMPSTTLAGKEVLIEQRVVFKLDLPNKKIISVKSKPCKVLSEVLRPILHKYNYQLELVTVCAKNKTEPLSMNEPVTSTDGLRLQVMSNDDDKTITQQTTLNEITNKVFNELMQQKTDAQMGLQGLILTQSQPMQLMQQPQHQHHQQKLQLQQQQQQQNQQKRLSDVEDVGGRSDDWCSEASSENLGQLRHTIVKGRTFVSANKYRKFSILPSAAAGAILPSAVLNSNDANVVIAKGMLDGSVNGSGVSFDDVNKKPLIAKWKAGAKLQNTSSPVTPDSNDLLEGLKRAQRFRLEDQRGTEINFELPDFLKDNGRSKLRKVKPLLIEGTEDNKTVSVESPKKPLGRAPQPAPRLSINRNVTSTVRGQHIPKLDANSNAIEENHRVGSKSHSEVTLNLSKMSTASNASSPTIYKSNANDLNLDDTLHTNDDDDQCGGSPQKYNSNGNGPPPPLPPKPKIKPSTWMNGSLTACNSSGCVKPTEDKLIVNANDTIEGVRSLKLPTDDRNNSVVASDKKTPPPRTIYFDQPNSSFV